MEESLETFEGEVAVERSADAAGGVASEFQSKTEGLDWLQTTQ